MRPNKKIGIFVPLAFPMKMVPEDFLMSFHRTVEYALQRTDELSFEPQIELFTPSTVPIDANRNECVGIALEKGFDITVWFDGDQKLADDTFYRLLKYGDEYPIYAGMYYLKAPPYHPIIMRNKANFRVFEPIWRYPLKEPFFADMIGMGCVKIDREVLEKLSPPYFAYAPIPEELLDDLKQDPEKNKVLIERMEFKQRHGVNDVSEDVAFWRQVKEKTDYKIVVDPLIQVGHVRKDVVDQETFFRFSFLNKKRMDKEQPGKFEEMFRRAELTNGKKPEEIEWVL